MPDLIHHARRMRQAPTDAEESLWRRLRQSQLGARFRRQHPLAGFILDFYCPSARLAIELDGGGHTEARQQHYDERRDKALR
jgi:very-short-patch-repair endonuclease